MEIGIVTEGPTDQIVIGDILVGYLENNDLPINPLQPLPNTTGNWDKVFKYCASLDFKQSLQFNDYVVIQIDSDYAQKGETPEYCRVDLNGLSCEEICIAIKGKLVSTIGEPFYRLHKDKILFAISVDEIECWLLPLYFSNKKSTAKKITGCIKALNAVLVQQEGFYIDAKELDYYRTMSKRFKKKKVVTDASKLNPSFKIFVEQELVKIL